LWTLTENNFLTLYRDGIFTSYSVTEALHEPVSALVSDGNGNALIETESGLYSFQQGHFVRLPEEKEKGVRQIFFGPSGTKWIFEQSTISQAKDSKVIPYKLALTRADLDTNRSMVPYEDRRGGLWLSTVEGSLYRLGDGVLSVFDYRDLGVGQELVINAFAEDGGSIWFFCAGRNVQQPNKLIRFQDGRFTSQLDTVVRYIQNQEAHHEKKTFRNEYLGLLRKFEVEFKDEYVFEFYD